MIGAQPSGAAAAQGWRSGRDHGGDSRIPRQHAEAEPEVQRGGRCDRILSVVPSREVSASRVWHTATQTRATRSSAAQSLGRQRRRSPEYVRAQIVMPLRMTSTDFVLSAAMRPLLATGVDYDTLVKDSLNYEDAANSHLTGPGLGVPSGALYSTVGDLAKLVSLELGLGPTAC